MEERLPRKLAAILRDDIYGDGVNVAARLESLAAPGGVCVSEAAYEQVKGRLDLVFEMMPVQRVKNIAEPVTAYRVLFNPDAAQRADSNVNLDDIFEIQEKIIETLLSAVEPAIGASERNRALRKSPESIDAWVLYQRGLALFYHGNTVQLAEAVKYFKRAIEIDPGFGAAHAMHAEGTFRILLHGSGGRRSD